MSSPNPVPKFFFYKTKGWVVGLGGIHFLFVGGDYFDIGATIPHVKQFRDLQYFGFDFKDSEIAHRMFYPLVSCTCLVSAVECRDRQYSPRERLVLAQSCNARTILETDLYS